MQYKSVKMILYFGLIFLLLGNALGVEVIWNDEADFDEAIIQGVNDGSITRVELPSFQIIFPGTLWCGTGNKSKSDDDLGFFKETDKCCRTHDMCDDIIDGGATRYNLTNPSSYTRLSCKCDMAFHNCLKTVNSSPSSKVGFIYFSMLGTQCFRLDYPITGCKKHSSIPSRRCLEYEFDTNGEKKYQWFDLPFFNKKKL